jgi:hypothetical protein
VERHRPVSQADQTLSDRLKAAGYPIEPRQLERWRVGGGVVERSGRPDAFDQARQVWQLLDDGLTLDQVAIVQFMRDHHVTTAALKRALHRDLVDSLGSSEPVRDWRDAQQLGESEAARAIDRLKRDPETKAFREEIQATAGRPGERVNQAATRVIATISMVGNFGEAPTRRDLAELLTAVGLPVTEMNLDAIANELRRATRHDMTAALTSATRPALDQAREDCIALTAAVNRLGYVPFSAPNVEHKVAVRLLEVLVLRKRLGDDEMTRVIQQLEATLPPDTG